MITKPELDEAVNRFLAWKLPEAFCPDGGVEFHPTTPLRSSPHWPTGTNLFTATEARAMFGHCFGITAQTAEAKPGDGDMDKRKLQTAIDRIKDLLLNDDGQAHSEARRFLEAIGELPAKAMQLAPASVESAPVVEQEASTGYYIKGKEVTQDELYRHVGAKVFDGLRKGNLPGCSQEVMRLREQVKELDEFRKANAELLDLSKTLEHNLAEANKIFRTERDKIAAEVADEKMAHLQTHTTLAMEIAELQAKLASIHDERDKLRGELQDFDRMRGERDIYKREAAELTAQLAAIKAPEPQDDWRELSKGDQYSGPGQVRRAVGDWINAKIVATDLPYDDHPFLAKPEDREHYTVYKFARVKGGSRD